MRFGIREVCDMHLEKLSGVGPAQFDIETAKTSTLEGASTTVYAQGGKGNSRLMAWEGEKTLTFTVEDALITMESFYALTGADVKDTNNGIKFTSKTTSFAGYYKITADTLFRDESGNDHPAYIVIPRAKLQSNLNLAMAPSGDPSAFTFTFDAMPGITEEDKDVLFTLEIYDKEDVTMTIPTGTAIFVQIEGVPTIETTETTLSIANTGVVTLGAEEITMDAAIWKTGTIITDLSKFVQYGEAGTFTLSAGTNKFYII